MWAKVDNSSEIYYMLALLLKNDTTQTVHNEVVVLSKKNKTEPFAGILLILWTRNCQPRLISTWHWIDSKRPKRSPMNLIFCRFARGCSSRVCSGETRGRIVELMTLHLPQILIRHSLWLHVPLTTVTDEVALMQYEVGGGRGCDCR